MHRSLARLLLAAFALAHSANAAAIIRVTEVMSSSGVGGTADWFELTNYGDAAIDISGWRMDDNSYSFAASLALVPFASGTEAAWTTIGPGESAVFLESAVPTTDVPAFQAFWTLGPNAGNVRNAKLATYVGSGASFSSGGDGVIVFRSDATEVTRTAFGAATVAALVGLGTVLGSGLTVDFVAGFAVTFFAGWGVDFAAGLAGLATLAAAFGAVFGAGLATALDNGFAAVLTGVALALAFALGFLAGDALGAGAALTGAFLDAGAGDFFTSCLLACWPSPGSDAGVRADGAVVFEVDRFDSARECTDFPEGNPISCKSETIISLPFHARRAPTLSHLAYSRLTVAVGPLLKPATAPVPAPKCPWAGQCR